MKILLIIVGGIAIILGGYMWGVELQALTDSLPTVVVEDDFSLTVEGGTKYTGPSRIESPTFPLSWGLFAGITWLICGIKLSLSDGKFPGVICATSGFTLMSIGIMNFLRDLPRSGDIKYSDQYFFPTPVLQYLFVDHPRFSIIFFVIASLILIMAGSILGGFEEG
jgi:hypothetical protein